MQRPQAGGGENWNLCNSGSRAPLGPPVSAPVSYCAQTEVCTREELVGLFLPPLPQARDTGRAGVLTLGSWGPKEQQHVAAVTLLCLVMIRSLCMVVRFGVRHGDHIRQPALPGPCGSLWTSCGSLLH